MIEGALSVSAIFVLLVFAEIIKKNFSFNPEVTRKFVHITVGSFVAFWPFFMPNWVIYAICSAFVSIILISRFGGLLPSIHAVKRHTWGDVLFPVGIALSLWLAHSEWIFAAGLLHLSVADGLAALVGEKFGKKNAYKIWGYKKTFAGNTAFFVISLGIIWWLYLQPEAGFSDLSLAPLLLIPFVATFIESVAVRGSDNIFVPIAVVWLLNIMQTIA